MKTIELQVEGMSCGGCVKRVTQALQAVEGVERVEVRLADGRVHVKGDFPSGSAPLIQSLAAAGYPAKEKMLAAVLAPSCASVAGSSRGCCSS